MRIGKRIFALTAVMVLAWMLAGCGSKEVVMKEFTSEDQTVSIQMNEEWNTESVGAGSEGWIVAGSENGAEAIVVMQAAKSLYGGTVVDMEGWKNLVSTSYPMSGMETIDNPSVPGMEVAETCSCTVTADGASGEGRVLYGETDYAYYSIVYAASKINTAKSEYFNKVCESFKENAPEVEQISAGEGSDTVQWFNNTCAVLTAANGWDYTVFGGILASDASLGIVQELLSEWWDVTDRESADETMDWLLSEGHRVSFAEDMEQLEGTGIGDVAVEERVDFILDNFDISEEEAQNYADWFGFYEQYGSDAAAGWDYSRAMSLLGYYYLAGFYTEEEALDKSLETAKTIQGIFDSWDSFMESYFVGYEYWSEENSDERRQIYDEIKASADNPFTLEWGMALEKTW